MAKNLLTLQDVADKVEWEGLGYTITDHIGSNEIEDPKLREAWEAARVNLRKIEKILGPYMP